MPDKRGSPRVGLFVTCLVDLFRPSVGLATVKLLRNAGCRVEVPAAQTCCGQPAYNSGDNTIAKAIARQVIEAFEQYDFLVAPSGSCIGMIKVHYPKLFNEEPDRAERAQTLADKSYEILSFVTDVLKFQSSAITYDGIVTYHDSCSGLRELGIKKQPRYQLSQVKGLHLIEMNEPEACCGFGGTFCVKYPELSERMVTDKVKSIRATGADTLLGGDIGCLLNIAGRLSRLRIPVRSYHTVEVLSGIGEAPAIGEPKEK